MKLDRTTWERSENFARTNFLDSCQGKSFEEISLRTTSFMLKRCISKSGEKSYHGNSNHSGG
jgi:hypothetical protein